MALMRALEDMVYNMVVVDGGRIEDLVFYLTEEEWNEVSTHIEFKSIDRKYESFFGFVRIEVYDFIDKSKAA